MKNVRVQDIAADVANETGMTEAEALAAVWATFDAIARVVAGGARVRVTNFGSFEPVVRLSRRSRNPLTGERIMTVEHTAPRFRATGEFPEMVRRGDGGGSIRKVQPPRPARAAETSVSE
ncbi:HU family DNA-binding protein [Streptomyces sp. NPDC005227]|uniref:HU family DNA-binding protein n=1 Tax=Streptomyces sp. NPDC005227 TaxID=3364707 RepID=UPI003677D70C